jgi:regulator of sigma E protease
MADFTTTVAAFLFVLGVIIFVHEFGHFAVAKAFGMRVFIFSFGFGKRLFGFRRGDTDYRVCLVPLGGYVKLEGEEDDYLSEDTADRAVAGDGRDFLARPRWQRFLVYIAGPTMNAALTIGVLTSFYMVGFAVDATIYDPPIVGTVIAGSPAAAAGIQPGDEILRIDGKHIASWEDAQFEIIIRPDATFPLRLQRAGVEKTVQVHASSEEQDKVKLGKLGVTPLIRVGQVNEGWPAARAGIKPDDGVLQIGDTPVTSWGDLVTAVQSSEGKTLALKIWRHGKLLDLQVTPRDAGAGPQIGVVNKLVMKKFGPWRSFVEASHWTWNMTSQTIAVVHRLVVGKLSPKTMMGPLGIAQKSGEEAKKGPENLMYLVAIISLQVGILNLFPVTPLDGGHMLILALEGAMRRDFSMRIKVWIINAGAVAIMALLVLVIYADLSRTSFFSRLLP